MNNSVWFMENLDEFEFECLNVSTQDVINCCNLSSAWKNYQVKDYSFEEIQQIMTEKVTALDAFVCCFSPDKYPNISIFVHPSVGLAVAGYCASKLGIQKCSVRCTNRVWNKKESRNWNFGYIQEFCVEKDFPPTRLIRVLNDEPLNFFEMGIPYTFEDLALYKNKRIADRFNRVTALKYMEYLGFPLCNEDLWVNNSKMVVWHYS